MGDLVTGAHHNRLQVTQPADDRLQQRADRGDHEVHLTDRVVSGVRVRQPAQDGQSPADGVAARAEPLVREGLPRGQDGHAG